MAAGLELDANLPAGRMRPAMPLAEVFDRHANFCTRAAEQTSHRTHRARLFKLAAYWQQAAQELRQATDRNESARAQSAQPEIEPSRVRRARRWMQKTG
jgi:hypothetical protein